MMPPRMSAAMSWLKPSNTTVDLSAMPSPLVSSIRKMRSGTPIRSRKSRTPSLLKSVIQVFLSLSSVAIFWRKNWRRSSVVFSRWISGTQSGCWRVSSHWLPRGVEPT